MDTVEKLLQAALPHVSFDGWGQASYQAAVSEAGLDPDVAQAACPRGAIDLAIAFHRQGDAAMLAQLAQEDLSALRFRDRVVYALRLRLEGIADKEAVRRGTALFALPQHAAEGAALIWETADAVWTALGDRSEDGNWYTKRLTLSGVYGATVLYWLGDETSNHSATWAFLDRRIADVMRVEKIKAQVRDSPILSRVFAGPTWVMGKMRAPQPGGPAATPGVWDTERETR